MYLPLSRKYRPQGFGEIIGQEHITTTLKNAISMGKAASAYLFTGQRGIGKTSTARVFAKALNCEKGPTQNPCNKCTACIEISKGISLDVLEIDGASNRGIDEIRNLRENLKVKPIYGKYKIYIIDEVHMLTPEAFNALLKTLEEPPGHVKFIFATTAAYKIPQTVVSRCQRFDFRMISQSVIIEKLKHITKDEKINVEENALFLIAKNAQGSLRDAEMILDQMASFTRDKIKSEDVFKMFGTLKEEVLIDISEALLNNDALAILKILDNLINSGKDSFFIAASLIEHFRNMMVVSLCTDSSSLIISTEEYRRKLEGLSHKFSKEELFYIIYTLSNAVDLIGKTSLGRIPLEVALIKLSRKEKLVPIAEILKQIEGLKSNTGVMKEEKRAEIPSPQRGEGKGEGAKEAEVKRTPSAGDETRKDVSPDEEVSLLKSVWPEVIRGVKDKKMSIGSYLEEGMFLEIRSNKVVIGFSRSNALHKEVLDSIPNKKIISQIIKGLLDKDFDIEFTFSEYAAKEEAPGQNVLDDEAFLNASKKIEPIIESAMDIFDGKIIKEDYSKGK